MRPLAIVFGLNYTARLGMIRAAGMAGCDVVVISTAKKESVAKMIDAKSKYVVEYHVCPNLDDEKLLILIEKYRTSSRDVFLLPTDDYPASVIDKHINELKSDFFLPHINFTPGEVVRIMDKKRQKDLAEKSGFDVAKSWTLVNENGRYKIPEGVEYPCFAKPQASYAAFMKSLMRRSNSESELKEVLDEFVSHGYTLPILVEQFIEIDHEYVVDGVSLSGKSIHPLMIEKGLIYKGVTATGRIINTRSLNEVNERLSTFFKLLGFTGVYDLELFESKGKIYFNELNARIGACGYAFIKSGMNYPQMLMAYLKDGEEPSNFVFESDGRTFASEKACLQLYNAHSISIIDYIKNLRSVDFRFLKDWSDIKPYWNYLSSLYLPLLVRRLLKKIRI